MRNEGDRVRAAIMTHRGTVRKENQDALAVAGTVRTGDMASPEIMDAHGYPLLLAVVDGMGGYAGGATAARILAETLSASHETGVFGERTNPEADSSALRALLESSALKMASAARGDPDLARMGATVAGVLLRERSALVFNCGDCRVYRISGGVLERLTREHSIVQALFEKGEISEDEMRRHPEKNIVTSAVSSYMADEFEIYTLAAPRRDDDSFFLCSDGVWEALDAERLTRRLAHGLSEAKELFDDLIAAGCRDNVSFVWQSG
jgi:protein phosphatase